jgi:hypothetical protein
MKGVISIIFLEACFVPYNMVCFGKVPWAAEKNVYCVEVE